MAVVRGEDGLYERGKRALAELLRYRVRAQGLGGDSLLIENNQTNNTWDISASVAAAAASASFRCTFTPDKVDGEPFYTEFEYNMASSYNPFVGLEGVHTFWADPATVNSTTERRYTVFYINYNYDTATTLQLKGGVRCTRKGTITWQRLT